MLVKKCFAYEVEFILSPQTYAIISLTNYAYSTQFFESLGAVFCEDLTKRY